MKTLPPEISAPLKIILISIGATVASRYNLDDNTAEAFAGLALVIIGGVWTWYASKSNQATRTAIMEVQHNLQAVSPELKINGKIDQETIKSVRKAIVSEPTELK